MNNFLKKHLSTIIFSALFALTMVLFLFIRNKYVVLGAFAICAIGLMFGLKKDRLAFLLFVLPFSRIFKLDIGQTSFFTILVVEYFGLIMLDYIISRSPFPKKAIIPIAIYGSFLVFSLIQFAVFHRYMGIMRLLSFFLYLALPLGFFIDVNRPGDEDKIDLVKFMIFGFASTILIALLSYVFKRVQTNLFYLIDDKIGVIQGIRRFSGLFGDSNYYAFYSLSVVSLLVLNMKKLAPKWLYALLGGFIFIIGYLSLSMMYILVSLILVVVTIAKLFMWNKKKTFYGLLIGLGVLLIVMFVAGDKIMGVIMAKIGNIHNLDDLATGRITIWKAFVDFFLKNPLLVLTGNGISASPAHQVTIMTGNFATHNILFEMLYDMGVLGSILFIAYYLNVLGLFGLRWPILKKQKLCIYFLISFFVCSMLIELAETDYTPFFLLIFAFSLGSLDKKEQVGLYKEVAVNDHAISAS